MSLDYLTGLILKLSQKSFGMARSCGIVEDSLEGWIYLFST